jgi:hypothetical protein
MMSDDDLKQADLSHLHVGQMNPAQKAEMKRRLSDFVKHVWKKTPAPAPRKPGSVTKWSPGRRK